MDRRRDRRAWRSARHYPRELRPRSTSAMSLDEARRFLSLPQPEPTLIAMLAQPGADRLARIRPPAVRHVAADRGHDRRSVFARTRHHGFARPAAAALSSALLLPARCRRPDRDLAGADRCRHRPRRQDHRRASHLARSVRPRQGARRHAAARDGPSARARRPVRRRRPTSWRQAKASRPCCRCAASADPADARCTLGQSPRRHPVPADAAPALCRARPRSGRRRRDGDLDRPRPRRPGSRR